jgi:ribokinase
MTTPRFDVCVVGSANVDLVATTDRLPAPGETVLGSSYAEHAGGKGLNQAVAAARAGARTTFVAAIGDDDAGRQLLAVMDADHIDRAALVMRPGTPTGRALIGVSAAGENSIIVVPGANAELTPDAVAEAVRRARVLLVQLEVPVATVYAALATARESGVLTILNPAPARELDADLLALCDVVIPNEHEVELLGGARRILELGARAVVITLGARGAMLCTAEDDDVVVPAFAVHAVDTTAAGDAFCGAFAAAMAAGDVPMLHALRYAAAAGALATTRAGAVPSLPTRDAIQALLTNAG